MEKIVVLVTCGSRAEARKIARLVVEWDQSRLWVEESIRRAMLVNIPRRDGGLKAPRAEEREAELLAEKAAREAQGVLEL